MVGDYGNHSVSWYTSKYYGIQVHLIWSIYHGTAIVLFKMGFVMNVGIHKFRKVKNWKMKEKRKEKSVNVQCAINDPTLTKYCVGKKH